VGTAGNQGPDLAACADPKVRGLLRRRQFGHRSIRTHDVRDLVEKRLGDVPYFAGSEFTAADIMMLFPLSTMLT
jgi:glutathione S-transferase